MCHITLVKVTHYNWWKVLLCWSCYYMLMLYILYCIPSVCHVFFFLHFKKKKMWHVQKMFYSILPCSWGSTSLDKLAFITDNGMPPKNWNAGTDKKSEKFINKYTSRNHWIISEPYYQLGMSFWDIPNTYIGLLYHILHT